MKYETYKAEDFFNDENFRNWILKNDPSLNFFWEKWILQNPDKRDEVIMAKQLVYSLKFKDEKLSEKQKKDIWDKITAQNNKFDLIEKSDSKVYPINAEKVKKSSRSNFYRYLYRVAALFLLIAISWYMVKNKPEEQVLQELSNTVLTKENPSGQKSKIYLSDGTVVYLNSSSKIQYHENFEEDKRIVYLSGEAFFEVAKDTLRPFIVISGSLTTTAIGTKFNINAYLDKHEIAVSLLEGKVEVKDALDKERIILEENQAVKFNIETKSLDEITFNPSESILWKDGILYFQKSSLADVIIELERWYGVKISVYGTPNEPIVISGRFENESLSNVLQSISFSGGFNYEIYGKTVNFNF